MLGRIGVLDGETECGRYANSSVDLAHILDLNIPLFVVDTSARIIFMNSSAEASIGRNASDGVGKVIYTLLTKESGRPDRALATAMKRCMSGSLARANVIFSTRTGPKGARCILIPLSSEGGGVCGALVVIRSARSEVPEAGPNIESSLHVLAKTSAEFIEDIDLTDIIDGQVSDLIASLDLDFAVFRFLTPVGRPLVFCHDIGYRDARELLDVKLKDGTPLYVAASRGQSIIADDCDDLCLELKDAGISSVACFPIHWSDTAHGCAVFGTVREGASARLNYPVLQVFCNQISISLRNAVLNQELKVRNTQLRGLYETSKAVSTALERDEVLHVIIRTAMELVDADNCLIFGLDEGRDKLCVLSMESNYSFDPTLELDVGEGITGKVASIGKGILLDRADLDPRVLPVEGIPDMPSSMIVVPLVFSDKLLGVMSLVKTSGTPFDRTQYELIELFSIQAAVAINNASLFRELKETASSMRLYNVLLTHDIANFNVPIHGFLEMLLKDPKLDDRQRRYVRSALIQSDNISELISDVRDLTRLRSSSFKVPLAPIDMIPLIKEAMEDIFSHAVYEDIETTFESTVEHAVVLADPFLKDLFYNLMSNACKYGQGRPVSIRVSQIMRKGREWWSVCILDSGKGIPDERKAQLFKRFDQMDTRHAADGHGLGLSVVAALIQHYGGRVWVEDRVPGDYTKGAAFHVLLPKIEQSPWPEG